MAVDYNFSSFVLNDLMEVAPESATPCNPDELKVHSLFRTTEGVAGEGDVPHFNCRAHRIATVYDNMRNDREHGEFQEALLNHVQTKYHCHK